MTNTKQDVNPLASPYGWPFASRMEEFRKAHGLSNLPTHQLQLQGKSQDLPRIRVPINLPKYRLINGRTSSAQVEFLAVNPSLRADLFSGDPELLDAQEVQHMILKTLAEKADLFETFRDASNGQEEPLLLDENGFVVNGNRRLAAWRALYLECPAKYPHFSHIEVVVLPHVDKKEIDRLEWRLQIKRDIKAKYEWHAKANMIRRQMQADGFSQKEMAEASESDEDDLKETLAMLDYAEEYLRSIGKENIWSLVSGDDLAFQQLVRGLKKLDGAGQKEVFKQAAFIAIEKPEDGGGRLYDLIRRIPDFYPEIEEKLQERFQVRPKIKDTKALDALFGGTALEETPPISHELAMEIIKSDESKLVARDVIVSVIDTQIELAKDAKKGSYLINQVSKSHTFLRQAILHGLRLGSNKDGVEAQLDQIEESVETIRAWISRNAAN
jgi:hypothetical protein